MTRRNWTESELFKVLHAYCEIPFGKIHSRNPEIVAIADALGRSPGSVALKMVNFASLDPTIAAKGMANTSKLDREVWTKFFDRIDYYLADEPARNRAVFEFSDNPQDPFSFDMNFSAQNVPATTMQRRGQGKFRAVILASYENRCALSGISDTSLLVASHIAPWASKEHRRLDPRNGICLNALWDRAFDTGLIALSDQFQVLFSDRMSDLTRHKLGTMGMTFRHPSKFAPDPELLAEHRKRFGFQ